MKLYIVGTDVYTPTGRPAAKLQYLGRNRIRVLDKHGRLVGTVRYVEGCFHPYCHGRRTHKDLPAAVASILKHSLGSVVH